MELLVHVLVSVALTGARPCGSPPCRAAAAATAYVLGVASQMSFKGERGGAPRLRAIGLAVTIVLFLAAVVVVGYRVTRPCWPWQDVTYEAGGTFCDGQQARFDTD